VNSPLRDLSLEKRIPLFAGIALVVILTIFTLLGLQAVSDSRNQALQERLVTARMIASHIDLTLSHVLRMLDMTAKQLAPDLDPLNIEREDAILASAYQQLGTFKHNLFLLDRKGNVLSIASGPESLRVGDNISSQPFVSGMMTASGPAISSVQCYLPDGTAIVCVAAPIKNTQGDVLGLLVGSIDVADPGIGGFVKSFQSGKTGYAVILEANGVILADTTDLGVSRKDDHSERMASLIQNKTSVVATCHNCHDSSGSRAVENEILAFAPISVTDWGVAIRQSEEEAFAPAFELGRKLGYLTLISVLAVVLLVWVFARSITNPLGSMTRAAERIAYGDLSHGVNFPGKDEIGRLSRAFEAMRVQLKDSLEQIRDWNKELERHVRQRTEALEASRGETSRLYLELQQKEQALRELLRKMISVQEEERRRIARELHDETSQTLTALAVGLGTAASLPGATVDDMKVRVEALRQLVVDTLDEVHKLIFDLRPSSLDDLGLVAALQSYAESRLEGIGVKVQFQADGIEDRLPLEMESALFRIVQEALTNVAKHAEANCVLVRIQLRGEEVYISIEDDGRGFAVDQALRPNGDRRGFGLLGMSERVALLRGELAISSHSGGGTRIEAHIPVYGGSGFNGTD